ncbi:hypothetical protein BASA81_003650 [Batrachochytrium salamandrivorans]|nr:hypothetical protein BASA81_003650 [Batrachochytrium salamandrivorans]
MLRQTKKGLVLAVRVVPNSSKTCIEGQLGGELKIRLQAAPVDGEANKLLVGLLAKQLGVPKSAVGIVSGAAARSKVLLLASSSSLEETTKLLLLPDDSNDK